MSIFPEHNVFANEIGSNRLSIATCFTITLNPKRNKTDAVFIKKVYSAFSCFEHFPKHTVYLYQCKSEGSQIHFHGVRYERKSLDLAVQKYLRRYCGFVTEEASEYPEEFIRYITDGHHDEICKKTTYGF